MGLRLWKDTAFRLSNTARPHLLKIKRNKENPDFRAEELKRGWSNKPEVLKRSQRGSSSRSNPKERCLWTLVLTHELHMHRSDDTKQQPTDSEIWIKRYHGPSLRLATRWYTHRMDPNKSRHWNYRSQKNGENWWPKPKCLLKTKLQVEYSWSENLKSEVLQNPKLSKHQHDAQKKCPMEYFGLQIWGLGMFNQ